MFIIRKLFELWLVKKTISTKTSLFARLLVSMAAVAVLSALSLMLVLIIMLGALWLGYHQMVASGIPTSNAVILLGCVMLVMLSLIILSVQLQFTRMRRISRRLTQIAPLLSARTSNITDAFVEGLLSDTPYETTR